MSCKEYLDRLAYLLQDIPDNEREEALNYYTGYFEDAGEGEEENAIATLGSPEKVAAMIKYDLKGDGYESAEYSESGYQDERFTQERKVPEILEGHGEGDFGHHSNDRQNTYDSSYYQEKEERGSIKEKNGLSIGLIVLLCIFAIPIGLPIFGAAFGFVVAILAAAFAILVTVAVLTVVFIVCGIVLIVLGIGKLFIAPAVGLLVVGIGMLILALGILMVLLSIQVLGKFMPWLVRGVVNLCSMPFKKGGYAA